MSSKPAFLFHASKSLCMPFLCLKFCLSAYEHLSSKILNLSQSLSCLPQAEVTLPSLETYRIYLHDKNLLYFLQDEHLDSNAQVAFLLCTRHSIRHCFRVCVQVLKAVQFWKVKNHWPPQRYIIEQHITINAVLLKSSFFWGILLR